MAFDFPLATLLRVRGIIEKREERLLQRLLFEISEVKLSLLRIDREITEKDLCRLSDRFKHSTGKQIHVAWAAVEELAQDKIELAKDLDKLEVLRDAQIGVLEMARQNYEMLTDIRAKALRGYEREVARRAQKVLDDNYMARRGRH